MSRRGPYDSPGIWPEPETEPGTGPEPPAGPNEDEREARLFRRFAQQWAQLREERRHDGPPTFTTGPSNFRRAEVPFGLDLAAGWAWRLLLIAASAYLVLWLIGYFSVVTVPLAIALLISALAAPFVRGLVHVGVPRGLSALFVVIAGFAVVSALLTFAGQQVASGASDLADSTVEGLQQIRDWLQDGPLDASDSQINQYIKSAEDMISEGSRNGAVLSRVTSVGSAVTHVVAGFFIAVFATYFFLADGARIWAWLVRLAPRAARERMDSSGRVAWISLVQFVRATVLVALVDAVGIAIGAAILDVPFVLAIGVLVFLGAFVPMIGATVAGSVAVLVALVDQGPWTALLMIGVVVGVQQLEGHVLQPFLLGRWVSLHPLGVIIAIAAGVLVAGVAGALVAVPLAAAANAVVLHLAEMAESAREEDSPVAGALEPAGPPAGNDGAARP
ncbi:AI-2E family transporter [Nocardioides sp. zg-536]|uniref:AI-2E family transporter n=1 Tax=Nocardioides faecalis TaxID=2803858 RepID=A0A938Y0C1_9ACTN|nr:AI-2E family transporter [Nocardioides faecalis]MBM9459541.1 AI-2E family transporter [Nocardioides faecalis]MBS4753679.1 AI-2E family transporter [Nocardioides faecalis]QVI58074.1 AI-2E family transporter [Nocardioides faecalis]